VAGVGGCRMTYWPRVADQQLADRLAAVGAVLIEGPKACGKTETARQVARSEVLLDVDAAAQAAIAVDPELVLDGPTPRLIDEWQLAADTVWNHVRRQVDQRGLPGQFILTGSASPESSARRHAGAGRFSVLRMRPMSLFESGHSSGLMSLSAILSGERPSCPEPGLSVTDIAELLVVGGWPSNLGRSATTAARANRDYLTNVREVDVALVGTSRRDPHRLERFLRSLARHTATEASLTTLCSDTGGSEGAIARTTAYDYLEVLRRLMIIEDQPAWATHLRSKATLRKAEKRHFVDPSLAVAALNVGPQRLLDDLNAMALLFESLVVRDVRVLSAALEATVFHYRDSDGREVDIVVQLPDGRWSAFEVKLGAGQVDEGAGTLLRFVHAIDTATVGPPVTLGVIAGGGYGHTRPDGVVVIPVGALAP
jgi:predicted AAA+ superfamily ATPase